MSEDFTLSKLRQFDGTDSKPIYVCLLGYVFDLSSKPQFYGPGGGYSLFAGHDASRCLATMSLKPEDLDKPIGDLSDNEKETLLQWKTKYGQMYPIVGTCKEITGEENAKV
eukprot:TRINITY_DN12198_c0_g1_i1.p1 TRINITY_DN12198_c0_g1~~TRINITY_DN12198_c0_g1_i1.p1  ORF type:complete len:111 (-),score=28.57 TRINITY_DN12198_c0_g1_i1:36-368(-)